MTSFDALFSTVWVSDGTEVIFIRIFLLFMNIILLCIHYSIISDPDIDLDRKKPFARILNEGYINTERDSLVSIAALSKNRFI